MQLLHAKQKPYLCAHPCSKCQGDFVFLMASCKPLEMSDSPWLLTPSWSRGLPWSGNRPQHAWPNGGSTLPVSVGSWLHRSKGNLSCPLPILPRLQGSCPRESECRWGSPPCDQTSGCLWLLCRKTPAREAVHTGKGEECCSASPVEEGATVFTCRGGLASLSWAASHPCLHTQFPRLLLTTAIMLNSESSFSRNPKWWSQNMLYAHSLHWQVTWTTHN